MFSAHFFNGYREMWTAMLLVGLFATAETPAERTLGFPQIISTETRIRN